MSTQPNKRRRNRRGDFDDVLLPESSALAQPPQDVQRHTTYEASASAPTVVTRGLVRLPARQSRTDSDNDKDIPLLSSLHSATLAPDDEGEQDSDFDMHWIDSNFVVDEDVEAPEKKTRTGATANPLLYWGKDINVYLRELLRLEGPADLALQCSCCLKSFSGPTQLLYRCCECQNCSLYCAACLIENHSSEPFHRIKEWNGSFFSPTTFFDLGLRVQLNHLHGEGCPNPESLLGGFVVLHTNGIHRVNIDFCNCTRVQPRVVQLLRSRLFPGTTEYPRSGATFALLEFFQLLSFMSKISAFEFYQTLLRRTDNTGTVNLPDRYSTFLRMIREWRHLKLLKRFGRGHDPSGPSGTRVGECAVLCPACPIPRVNLPEGWENAPSHESWLYSLFVGIDANFRLKRLKTSTDERDPGLNRGYAYFVNDTEFKRYLDTYGEVIPDDISTCNNHDAIKSASIRGGKGIDASGTGKTECARHDMKRPVSVGDLQKGERYVNMDYFFLSSMGQNPPRHVVVSYDIACQWGRNLAKRCTIYPPNPYTNLQIHFLVPKFHLPAHRPDCRFNFSFNYTPGVGRTDGEAPERGWAAINNVANSTKEMGPGSRRDTLDDHFGDYNWRKIVIIASTFSRKLKEAIKYRAEQVEAFEAFDLALPVEDTTEWTRVVQTWEADGTQPNPFATAYENVSESRVRLELAREDEAELREDLTAAIHEDVPPSRLIAQGLELEDHQRVLLRDTRALGAHSTDLQRSKILERSNRLLRKLEAWAGIQVLYMPGVAALRAKEELKGGAEPSTALNFNLWLPSAIITEGGAADAKYLDYEWRLRTAQAHATLLEVRRNIILRSMMFRSKDKYIRGQRLLTRSQALLLAVEQRIKAAAKKYNEIRAALKSLNTATRYSGWDTVLKELNDSDLRGLTADEGGFGEGRRNLSWIWSMYGADAVDGEEKQEALRIEWCKARARAHRWQEECLLLEEEMRRCIAFFQFQARRWEEWAGSSYDHVRDGSVTIGLRAYAFRRAALYRQLVVSCSSEWATLPSVHEGIGAPNGTQYRIELH
ncbi:hypothetical protein DXG01_008615 [Tephrocybe rancida]|nr:hypothetical protein DXG01_008615 [Tephrocybe rancida]